MRPSSGAVLPTRLCQHNLYPLSPAVPSCGALFLGRMWGGDSGPGPAAHFAAPLTERQPLPGRTRIERSSSCKAPALAGSNPGKPQQLRRGRTLIGLACRLDHLDDKRAGVVMHGFAYLSEYMRFFAKIINFVHVMSFISLRYLDYAGIEGPPKAMHTTKPQEAAASEHFLGPSLRHV